MRLTPFLSFPALADAELQAVVATTFDAADAVSAACTRPPFRPSIMRRRHLHRTWRAWRWPTIDSWVSPRSTVHWRPPGEA